MWLVLTAQRIELGLLVKATEPKDEVCRQVMCLSHCDDAHDFLVNTMLIHKLEMHRTTKLGEHHYYEYDIAQDREAIQKL